MYRNPDQQRRHHITRSFDPTLFRTEIKSQLSNKEITYLIEIGLFKGNKPDHILRRMKGGQAKKFKAIANRIGLLNSDEDKKPSLSRVCLAFPEITCDLLQKSPMIGPVSCKDCNKATGLEDFPAVARHQACAAIIPKTLNFRAEALEVVMLSIMLLSNKVQTDEWLKKKSRDQFNDSFFYLAKTFDSNVFGDAERWVLARKYGIITGEGDLTESWQSAAAAASQYFNVKYKCGLEGGLLGVKVDFQ